MKGGTETPCSGINNTNSNCWINAQLQTLSVIDEAYNPNVKILFDMPFTKGTPVSLDDLRQLLNKMCPSRKGNIEGGESYEFILPAVTRINEHYPNLIGIINIRKEDYSDPRHVNADEILDENNKYMIVFNHISDDRFNFNKHINNIYDSYGNDFTPVAFACSIAYWNLQFERDSSLKRLHTNDDHFEHQYAIRHCNNKYYEIDDERVTELTKLQVHNFINLDRILPFIKIEDVIDYVIFKKNTGIDYKINSITSNIIVTDDRDVEEIIFENDTTSIENKEFIYKKGLKKLDFSSLYELKTLKNITIKNVNNIYFRNENLEIIDNLKIDKCDKLFINTNSKPLNKLDFTNVNAEHIELANNGLFSLTFSQQVKSLDISFNNFFSLVFFSEMYHNLRSLNLSHNEISDLPTFMRFDNLEELSLANNQISTINETTFVCAKLGYLSLENNKITGNFEYRSNYPLRTVDIVGNEGITTIDANNKIEEYLCKHDVSLKGNPKMQVPIISCPAV